QLGVVQLSFALEVFHQHTVGEVNGGGQQHDDGIDSLSPVVKEQRGAQKHQISKTSGYHIVDRQGQNKKIKQEEGGGKDHEAVLLLYGGKIEQGAADGRALPLGLWIRTER